MAEQTITETQFLREDPRLEAIKLDLLEQASSLTRGKDAAVRICLTNKRLQGVYQAFRLQGSLLLSRPHFKPACNRALEASCLTLRRPTSH
jgi:hypothetical protein